MANSSKSEDIIYYTYALYDMSDKVELSYDNLGICFLYRPFYVGKGKDYRLNDHFQPRSLKVKNFKNNKIKNLTKRNIKIESKKIISDIDEETALNLEVQYIKTMGRRDLKTGFLTNQTDGGDGITKAVLKTRKKVSQIDPTTFEIIKTYDSITIAAEEISISTASIINACKKKNIISSGFLWRYYGDVVDIDLKIEEKCVKIDVYDMNKKFIKTFNSIVEAMKALKIKKNGISNCCRGKVLSAQGYKFEYNDPVLKALYNRDSDISKRLKKIYAVKNDKIIKTYESVIECMKDLNLSANTIYRKCEVNYYLEKNQILLYSHKDYIKGVRKKYRTKNVSKEHLWKKVDKIDPNTFEIIDTYKSIAHAALKNNIKYAGCISTCCNKKGKIFKGFIWRFHGDKIEDDFIYKKNTVKINVYDLDKNFLKTTKSIHEASKLYNDPDYLIARLICGIGNPTNYLYEYYDEELKNKYNVLEREKYHQHTKKVCLVENNNDIVKIYDSLVECSNDLNISTTVINKHCNNKIYTNISHNLYYYDVFIQGYRKTYHKKRNSEVKIYTIDIKSGEITNYNSTIEAIKKGFNNMSIQKYLKLGTEYKGFLWYYGEKVL